MCAL
ncbi:hypothetical protein D046_1803A, partial [Vibrio parahaemolyticus V-223/04]|jgi:hypothetical protein